MRGYIITVGIFFAVLSTAVLSYISMAAMIGPWIAPTLVLMGSMLLRLKRDTTGNNREQTVALALMQSVGSVGGAVGMAIGFSLPTLYFLDPNHFRVLLDKPLQFCVLLTSICMAAGGLGIILARRWRYKFIHHDNLSFPVSNLIHRVITTQTQGKEARAMLGGFSITAFFCLVRDGFMWFRGILPKTIYLFPSLLGREASIALFAGPTFWAIGFTTGAVIAFPLLIGMLLRYLVLSPLNHHSLYLPYSLFPVLDPQLFTLAFCSGLVLSEFVIGLRGHPKIIIKKLRHWRQHGLQKKSIKSHTQTSFLGKNNPGGIAAGVFWRGISSQVSGDFFEIIFVGGACYALLTYCGFSLGAQACMIALIIMATYQISLLSARLGIVPFGRFATYVMVPMMLLFSIDVFQITLLCVFVNVCAGVATDLLFDYKVGNLCSISFDRVHRYQWLGLVATALSVGLLLLLFFSNFEIGSPELYAQRGKTRALLIQSLSFNYWVLVFGFLCGFVIKKFKISPSLTLGGILMPNSISIGLIIGGMLSKFFPKPERLYPFWSGVFACEPLWILICMLVKCITNV